MIFSFLLYVLKKEIFRKIVYAHVSLNSKDKMHLNENHDLINLTNIVR